MTSSSSASVSLQRGLFAALFLSAAVSLVIGCSGALHSSKDLQWGAAHLLLQHNDPYAEALRGYPHAFAKLSPPNYLPEFYLLLLPLALLDFHTAAIAWCVLTILLSIATMGLLEKIFNLPRAHSLALLLLLWCSAPFRTMLQVGQMSQLELLFFCLVFFAAEGAAGLALGLSFAKYSFSPVALGWFLFRGRYRLAMLSIVAPLMGLAIAWRMVAGSLLPFALEPLRVSQTSVWPGLADLMTLAEYGLKQSGASATLAGPGSYAVAFAAALAFSFALRRKNLSSGAQFTLIAVASLFTFKHLLYDYVFLLVPLCYAASTKGRPLLRPVAAAIGFFWFLIVLVPRLSFHAVPTAGEWAGFLLPCALLGALLLHLTRAIVRIEDPPPKRADVERNELASKQQPSDLPGLA